MSELYGYFQARALRRRIREVAWDLVVGEMRLQGLTDDLEFDATLQDQQKRGQWLYRRGYELAGKPWPPEFGE